MRDPYTVLGLGKAATADDIKKAYRRLAKTYHPDQSKDPKAKDRFAEVGAAYEILGDEKKRGSFDRGEIDAEGKPKFTGFEGFGAGPGAGAREGFEFNFGGGGARGRGGFDAADIFSDLFGGGAAGRAGRSGGFGGGRAATPVRGEDVQAVATVSLAEAVHGGKTVVTLPSGRALEVSVPTGIESGKQIRLKGQGQAGVNGGSAGDALVTIHVTRHPHFRTEGADLRLDLPITFYEAVLGATVAVPTLEGQVEMNLPAGTNGGRVLRLRGKGGARHGGGRGDLLVALRIVLPDDAAATLGEAARTMQADAPYDPRRALG